MTPEQFCYWLNGFGELTTEAPTAEQWKAIKEHLETVFKKITPAAPGSVDPLNEYARKAQRDVLRQADPLAPYRANPNYSGIGYPVVTC